jgi:F-type H+-transporting ATPase subunit alpha
MDTHHREIGKIIADTGTMDDKTKSQLIEAIEEFKKIFLSEEV